MIGRKYSRDVAIVGVGMIRWGRYPEKTIQELAAEAVLNALRDARLSPREIESAVSGSYHWIRQQAGVTGLLSGNFTLDLLGIDRIPLVNVANACATGHAAFREACLAIASGEVDVSLAFAGDKSALGFFRPQSDDPNDVDYIRFKLGITNPAYWAMMCRRRMHDLGTTEDDLAMVKVITSKAGALNPYARYQKVFSREEVLKSPMVCDPFRLYMICTTSDGAAAVVLAEYQKARKITDKPVLVEGVGLATPSFGEPEVATAKFLSSFSKKGVPPYSQVWNAAGRAYSQAGRRPEDIDAIELSDNSPWQYFAYLEAILNLDYGEAEKLLRRGDTDPINGRIPVGPSGGFGAFGEATAAQGLAQICELTWQLRGQGGGRQVRKELKVALAQTHGYAGNAGVCILSRGW